MADSTQFGRLALPSEEVVELTRPPMVIESTPRRSGEISVRADMPTWKPLANPGKPAPPNIAMVLLKALSRRWRSATFFGLLAAAAAFLTIWTQLPPPKPSAAAKLYIPTIPPSVLVQHPDPPLERGTQIALVRSRLVLTAAIRPPVGDLPLIKQIEADGGEPLDWLAKNLQVDFSEGTEIMRIGLTYDDGEQAKVLVNAVKDAYLTEIHGTSKKTRNEKLLSLTKHLERADGTLKTLRDQAQTMLSDDVTLDDKQFKLQQELASNQATMIKTQLLAVKGEQLRLQAEMRAFQGRSAAAVTLPDHVMDGIIAKDPEVIDNLTKRNDLEKRLRDIRKVGTDAAILESTKALTAQLEATKKVYETLRVNLRSQVEERVNLKSKSELEAHQKSLKEEYDSNSELEKLLEDEFKRLNAYIKSNNKRSYDLDPLRIQIKLAEGLYERVKTMITNMNLEQDAPPRVLELEKAFIVPVEITRRKLMMSGVGALGAIGLVCLIIGFFEMNRKRIESTESVTNQLGLTVLGTVPRQAHAIAKRYGSTGKVGWKSMMTESINSTRTMLLHGHGISSARVIQITSPVSGEGKTTLSAHLAASMAMAGRRTVLVDGDLRNPNAHKPFQLPDNEPGLCEVLRGETSLESVLRPTTVEGLTMLPAGKWGEDTSKHLASASLEEVFSRLRQQFDLVIVDSSPVLPVSDPLLFARHVDGVLVSLLQNTSRLPLVEEANRRLASLRVPVLGAVLHGTQERSYGYGSRYQSPVPSNG